MNTGHDPRQFISERHRRPCRRLSPPPPSPTPARQVVEDLREEAVEDAQEDAEERQDALIATLFVPGPEGEYYDCVEESDVDADDE